MNYLYLRELRTSEIKSQIMDLREIHVCYIIFIQLLQDQ